MQDVPSDMLDEVIDIIRVDLKLGDAFTLEADTMLFGGDLDLDSLDALLLITSMEKRFGVVTPREKLRPEVFATPRTIAAYVRSLASGNGGGDASTLAATPDLKSLLSMLPHREPFRFVTDLRAMMPGHSGEGVWRVDGSEPFFRGHFPGRPIVPGVLLTEALAQLSGLVAGAASAGPTLAEGRLAHMDVRCSHPVAPPAGIVLRSRRTAVVDALYQFEVQAVVDDRVVAEGQLAIKLGGAGGNATPSTPE